jgi:hypothetical protein
MNLKSISVFVLLFGIQFLMSCIPYACDCSPGITITIKYDGVSLKALDTSGFQYKDVVDSVHRNSFGLLLTGLFTESTISELQNTPQSGSGFSSAMACSCVGNDFRYPDPIVDVDIYIIDNETDIKTSANEAFHVFNYNTASNNSINEIDWSSIFQPNWYPYVEVSMELINEEAVASSSIFEVVLTLESGKTLTNQTQVINFFD